MARPTIKLIDGRKVMRYWVRVPAIFYFYSGIPVGDIVTKTERVIPIF